MNFQMKNGAVKKEKRIIFLKTQRKKNILLHNYVYNDNKNIYKLIKRKSTPF